MEQHNSSSWRHDMFTGNRPANPRKRPADTQETAWVAGEDRFVLQQAKKKAEIRVKSGRARPIDWLTVTLRFIDPTRDPFDEETPDSELDIVDPEGVFEGLSESQLADLERDIDTFLALETNRTNRDFWQTMKLICSERRHASKPARQQARGVASVTADVDRLLEPKSFEELEALERQIRQKLQSNEPIDVDYWEHLLQSLLMWKARAKLRRVSQSVIKSRVDGLRKVQEQEAIAVSTRFSAILESSMQVTLSASLADNAISEDYSAIAGRSERDDYAQLDPEPSQKLHAEDKGLDIIDERGFLKRVTDERRKVLKLGYVPFRQRNTDRVAASALARPSETTTSDLRPAAGRSDDFSRATTALYEREVARGVDENEEIFAGEEEVATANRPQWANKHRPRKPRYFNRVQMGYEWNKYNQTHYDHDNPPPKVVQGYKFNIFYPDLIEKTKAPTYRIERENGRKRGQSFAPAGEEDTCLIRFVAGPPYEDIAFRIVDKEWDYSAKRDRGFRSSFDKASGHLSTKGILQLHFQFKKIYYRK